VVEILSPATARRDRLEKKRLYEANGVEEYWLVDPETQRVEVLVGGAEGLVPAATYQRGQALVSPLLAGLTIELDQLFS
jgi:Uma2 family endonuclease